MPSLSELERRMEPAERILLLGSLNVIREAQDRFPKGLCFQLLPPDLAAEQLLLAIRSLLAEARLQHDLEAAENVAWGRGSGGQFDDPSIELLGASIVDLSSARDMDSVEAAVLRACSQIGPVSEVKVRAYPETATSREIGRYQLAVPVHLDRKSTRLNSSHT